MNHKRKRHKAARAGCLLCYPQKRNGSAKAKMATHKERRVLFDTREQLRDVGR